MDIEDLTLERHNQDDRTPTLAGGAVMMTPLIEPDYWSYRVRLTEGQAVVGFPKFSTIGIGFAEEEDWNTNLPYTCDAEEIRRHIWHNRGDDAITPQAVDRAIELIQAAACRDRGDS